MLGVTEGRNEMDAVAEGVVDIVGLGVREGVVDGVGV
jgi:hypothetical protein